MNQTGEAQRSDNPLVLALLFGFGIFSVTNVPSIKLVYGPTDIVNIFAVAVLLLGAFAKFMHYTKSTSTIQLKRGHRPTKVTLSMLFALFVSTVVLPELAGIRSPTSEYPMELLGLVYTFVVFMTAMFITEWRDIYYYFLFQIIWGLLVSTGFLLGIVDYASSPNMHYNTVSLPITLSTIILIGFTAHPKHKVQNRILLSLSYIVLLAGILSLHGRRPILGIMIAIIFSSFTYRRHIMYVVKEKWLQVTILSFPAAFILGELFSRVGSDLLVDRLSRLIANPTQESRVQLYMEAIRFIKYHPIGGGLGAFAQSTEYPYPHNLFLHAFTSGGLISGFLFLTIVLSLFWKDLYSLKTHDSIIIFCLTLCVIYLLLVFSTSYAISDTYILFALLGAGTSISKVYSGDL